MTALQKKFISNVFNDNYKLFHITEENANNYLINSNKNMINDSNIN